MDLAAGQRLQLVAVGGQAAVAQHLPEVGVEGPGLVTGSADPLLQQPDPGGSVSWRRASRLGVAVTAAALVARGVLLPHGEGFELTAAGEEQV